MTLDAVLHILIHSEASDWYRIPCGDRGCGPSFYYRIEDYGSSGINTKITGTHTSIATYRQDLSITMAWGMKAGKNCEEAQFRLPFDVGELPKNVYLLDLFYSGSLVFRTTYFQEEGGTCKLPLADAQKQVPQRYADVIRRLNELEGNDGFEATLERNGATVVDATWPV